MNTRTTKQTIALFAIIIIEGYVVLSTELLTIRQTIPYIGSGTDTVAVIIASILMPLAFGYQFAGHYKPQKSKISGRYINIRAKLISNICIAASILFIGMSYPFMHNFFGHLSAEFKIQNPPLKTAIFCSLFIVMPTYLLGQTVPLISNFFKKEHLPKITGHILFFSTLGSFLGATFSTLVLMATLGVHHTLTLNFVLMAILVIILHKNPRSPQVIYITLLALSAMLINSNTVLKAVYPHMRVNNQYSVIQAGSLPNGDRTMMLNLNFSSKYNDKGEKYPYINIAEQIAINPILNASPPKQILVIGAGGFTFGHNDKNNIYTYVDINKDIKKVAERYILKEPIGKNKKFIPKPARAFLYEDKNKYDMIYLDTYLGGTSIPEHLVTREFFLQIKDHMKEESLLITNFVSPPNFSNKFSQTLDNTIRSVFPYVSRLEIGCPDLGVAYNYWGDISDEERNIAYIYQHRSDFGKPHIYTDNINNMFYEKR